jgi:hypothetical protein
MGQAQGKRKGVLVVMTDPVPGEEDAYNEWYDDVHLAEVVKLPGVTSGQRFVAIPSLRGQVPVQRYMALYEFEGDVEEALETLRRTQPDRPTSPALDQSTALTYTFAAIGERLEL